MYTPAAPFNPQADVLRHYTGKAQDAEYVALQNYSITDLAPLMPQLATLKRMRHLNLSGNNLARLPEDMSALGAVETLDVSRNAFTTAEAVLAGLYSIPRLLHLKISLPEAEENKLVATLTSVQTINGVVIDDEDLGPEEAQRREEEAAAKVVAPPPSGYSLSTQAVKIDLDFKPWTAADSERFARLYSQIGAVSGKVALPEEYSDYARTVLAHLRSRTSHEADVLKLQCHQFNAAALLMEFSFDELVRVCSLRFGADVGAAMQGVFEQHLALVRTASVTMAVMQEDRDRRIAAIQEDLKKEILLRERMQRAYEAEFGATLVGGRIQYSDAEMRKGPAPNGLADLYPQMAAAIGGGGGGSVSHSAGTTAASPPGSPFSLRGAGGDYSDYPSSPGSPHSHRGGSPRRQFSSTATFGAASSSSAAASSGQQQPMQLPELRNFIKTLLKSKAESDEANAMARLPPETLEQHIYTLLCAKTSSPDVIKRRVQSFYSGLALYGGGGDEGGLGSGGRSDGTSEVDIEAIRRVLAGTLDESYLQANKQHEGIVYDAVSEAMRARLAVESASASSAAAAAGGVGVGGGKAAAHADEMLDERQAKAIIDVVVPWPAERRMRLVKDVSRFMRRKEFEPSEYVIHHRRLARAILHFFLAERVAAIADISEQFLLTDRDRTGVIDVNHFKHLVLALFPRTTARAAQQLALSADPFDNNVVNFNTAVRVVEAYRASALEEDSRAVLQSVEARRAHIVGDGRQPPGPSQQQQQQPPQQRSPARWPTPPQTQRQRQQQQQQQPLSNAPHPNRMPMAHANAEGGGKQPFIDTRAVHPGMLPADGRPVHYVQRSEGKGQMPRQASPRRGGGAPPDMVSTPHGYQTRGGMQQR